MKEFVKNLLLSILGCFLIGYPIVLFYALWGVVWLAVEIWDMMERARDRAWMYKNRKGKM